ncbi:MAG: hypothetical protein R6V60_19765, partial [Desulfobacterales bacterium]
QKKTSRRCKKKHRDDAKKNIDPIPKGMPIRFQNSRTGQRSNVISSIMPIHTVRILYAKRVNLA